MEGLYIRPIFNPKNTVEPLPLRDNSSPDLSTYTEISQKYKKYIDDMNTKIDKICEK